MCNAMIYEIRFAEAFVAAMAAHGKKKFHDTRLELLAVFDKNLIGNFFA